MMSSDRFLPVEEEEGGVEWKYIDKIEWWSAMRKLGLDGGAGFWKSDESCESEIPC